ncbi:MAG: hypothetical protein IKQ12_07740 [Prevotella sp.]|nr:hypothetical protein [Prevotella sp.]
MKIKLKDHARQLWLSLLLMVGVAAIAVPELVETNGTIEISTVEQLMEFRDAVNRGNTYAGKTVKLTADLDLSSESNWTPIGNLVAYPSQSFNGTFDGDGHSISNVTVNDNTPNHAVAGLFGSVENGTIKNLTVKNVDLTSTHYAGGIVAYTSNGPTIENCKVIGGTIKSTPEVVDGSYDNGDKVGGIMGYATAGSTINNCTVEGVTITAYRDMGGIVGFSAGTVTNNTAINVTVTQDLTNGYKDPAPTTFGDIIGRDGGATLSNNKVIKGEPVAKIGDEKYYSLADAVAAAQQMGGAVTVELIDDISGETVTIKEDANFKLTIDGKKDASSNYTVDADISIDGLNGAGGSVSNGASVTLQNIAFLHTTSTDGIKTSRYPHDLTIQDCTYSGSNNDKWFLNASATGPLYGVTVKNVTVEHARLIYANLSSDAVFENIVATNDVKVGFNIKTGDSGGFVGNVLIQNCQVATAKYAFRDYEDAYNGTITLEGNTFTSTSEESDEGAIVNRGGVNNSGQIKIVSGTYDGHIRVLKSKEGVLAISGGYFSEEFPQEYIAADLVAQGKVCTPATDMEGFFTIGDPHYVAQIGEAKYVSLQAAINAANETTGDVTITLIDDITGYSIVHQKAGLNLTIDGADKTVAGQIIIDGDGRLDGTDVLTIQNIKFEMPSEFCTGTDAFVVVPSTKTTGAPYYDPSHNNHAHNITISDCTFTGNYPTSNIVGFKSHSGIDGMKNLVMQNVTATNLHSLAQLTAAKGVTFDNCTATQTGSFIAVNGGDGTYTVSNCTFESHPDKTDGYAYREKSNSTAVTTLTNNNFKAHDAIILGSAGTINVESGTYVGEISKTAGTIAISGGKFSAPLADAQYAEFIAEGLCGVNGLYEGDAPNGVGTAVATVTSGETVLKYASLEAAIAAATDGATVTLLANSSGNGIQVPQGKYSTGLTVDFGGFTYTMDGEMVGSTGTQTQAFQLLKDNKITFKNGTIYSEKAKMLVQNYSNLTLEGMTLTLDNANYTTAYTLSNNNGNVVIDGTTINANPAGKYAFDVCRYASYPSVSVTVKGESVINGNIQVDAGSGDPKDGLNLSLEAGTFSGIIELTDGAKAALADAEKAEKTVITKSNSLTTVAAPQDYKWVDNGDETSTLAPCEYVAQIGETKYESLADAVAAVPTDGTQTTITMIADEIIVGNAGVTIPVGKNVVLDLNGKTITLSVTESKGSQLITNRGTLTITDSSEGQTGKLTNVADESLAVGSWPTNNYVTNVITNSGTLNIEAGNIISTANGSICYAVDNNSTSYDAILNIKGGYLTSVGTVVRQFCNSTTKQNVINMTGGVVTTNGSAAIWTQLPGSSATSKKLATLNISGGEITASSYAWYDYSYGDSFEAVEYNISGGKFTGRVFSYALRDGIISGFISGGLFSPEPSSSYIKTPGYMFGPSEEVEGYYTLVPAEVDYSWIENGEVIHDYLPFNTPFKKNYLMDGETITLLQDITLTEDLTWNTEGDATFTLNLGEYKITKGNFSIKLKSGQRVNTDKTTSINAFTADEGYVVKSAKDEDGKYYYTVEEAEVLYTAANGTVKYMLCSGTMVSGDGTYKLLKDVTTTARLTPGIACSNWTLDLNGHTLTSTATDCAILLSRAGTSSKPKTFNLIDSSDEKGGILKVNPDANLAIQVSGKYNQVTIGEGVTIDGNCVALLSENQTLTVNGTINGGNDFAVATNGSTTKNATIIVNEGAVLTSDVAAMYLPGNEGLTATINGGTITGGTTGIEIRAGQLVVNGGDITSTATEYGYTPNGNGTTTKGAAIAVVQHTTLLPIDAQVLGGTLTGLNQIAVVDAQANDLKDVSVKAKDDLIVTTTIPDGFKWASNGDGTSSLVPKTYVAQIGEGENAVKYETLQEAVNAAGTSETTITLLEEAAVDGVISGAGVVVPSGSNITFDLNGLTYNVSGETVGSSTTETQGFQLLKNSNITFKDGTLKATSPTAQMVIQNYSNLTLEDVNVDGTGLSGWAYALSNNCGTINLTGSTSITAKEGGRAFDTCKFGDYAIPTVNINTTGVISGPIEATGGKLNIENGKFDVTWVTDSHYAAGDIQITGGVFTEKPSEEYCAEGYVPTFNTDPETKANYPYAVKSKDDDVYELIDTENYPFMDLPSDIAVSSVTYKRSFSSTQVGKHQAWFVPMDYTITADDAANFTFYKIQMIAGAAEAGEADHDKIYLYIEPMNEGEVLKGNRPYTVKPKNVVTDYEFTAENTTLYAPTTKSRLNVTTSFHSYDFYGKYANDPYTGSIGDWFSLSQGSLHPNPASTTFRQYRWIIKVTANTINDDYSKIEFSIVEDGDATGIDRTRVINSDDVEGIYTTNGMKVDEPVRGINIIRYKNGKTEKIIVK